MGARHRGLSGMDSAAARVRRRCRCSLHLYLGSCALRVDRGRGIRGRGPGRLLFAVDGIIIGHVPYVLASMGMGFASIGVALLTGAGAWTASKQIARLSALWAKKAVSPFWKDRGNKSRMGAEAAPLTA